MAKKEAAEKGFDSIVYYQTWAKALKTLPDDLRLRVYDAIGDYIIDETEPTDKEVLYSVFSFIVEKIKEDKDRYAKVCRKRGEAGKSGAAKRWSGTKEKA